MRSHHETAVETRGRARQASGDRPLRHASRGWKPIVLAVLACLPLVSVAAVYKCKGADGSTTFADAPCGPDAQLQDVRPTPPVSGTPVPARRGAVGAARPVSPVSAGPVSGPNAQGTGASDPLNAYLSDAHLLASRQDAAPQTPLQYSDPANGALLKSVLNPARVKSVVDLSTRGSDTRRFDELRHLLEPLQRRYATAFDAQAPRYEAEYLDTLDITAVVMQRSTRLLQSATQAAPSTAAAPTSDEAKLRQSMASLSQGVNGMMVAVAQGMAKSIRQQVASGKFTPAGARHATAIANSIAPAS